MNDIDIIRDALQEYALFLKDNAYQPSSSGPDETPSNREAINSIFNVLGATVVW